MLKFVPLILFLITTNALVGDAQVKQAFEYSLKTLQSEIDEIIKNYRLPLVTVRECLMSSKGFPDSTSGSLDDILSSGEIIIGYLKGQLYEKEMKVIIAKATRVVANHYHKTITAKFLQEDSSVRFAQSLFHRNVTATLPSPTFSPFMADTYRFSTFAPACAFIAFDASVYVAEESAISDYQSLYNSLTSKEYSNKIAVETTANDLFVSTFPDLVQFSELVDDVSTVNLKNNGGIVAIFCTRLFEKTDYQLVQLDLKVPLKMFFRKEEQKINNPFGGYYHLGNTQLRQGFDHVIAKYQTFPNDFDINFNMPDGVSMYKDCSVGLAKPKTERKDMIKHMIKDNKIIIGTIFSPSSAIGNWTTNITHKITEKVETLFGLDKKLRIVDVVFNTTSEMAKALDAGTIDVACGAVWGFGEAEETCALAGVRPRLWVSMESQNDVHTTEDLDEKLKESLSNYLLAENELAREYVKMIFPDVSVVSEANATKGFERLTKEQTAIAFVTTDIDTPIGERMIEIETNLTVPVSLIFRADRTPLMKYVKNNLWVVIVSSVLFVVLVGLIVVLIACLRKRKRKAQTEETKPFFDSHDDVEAKGGLTKRKGKGKGKGKGDIEMKENYNPPEVNF